MAISTYEFYDKLVKKDVWKISGDRFLVEIVHKSPQMQHNEVTEYGDGGHRWAVYAYIYPGHVLFNKFTTGKACWQPVTANMPLHAGCSYHHRHFDDLGMLTSHQVGADYHHCGEWQNSFKASLESMPGLVADAVELYNYLSTQGQNEPDQVPDDNGGPAVATENERLAVSQ